MLSVSIRVRIPSAALFSPSTDNQTNKRQRTVGGNIDTDMVQIVTNCSLSQPCDNLRRGQALFLLHQKAVYIQCLWQADQSHIDPRVALMCDIL
jgi:hypothetical protein